MPFSSLFEETNQKYSWLVDLELAVVIKRFYIFRQSLERGCAYILSDMKRLWLKVNEALCSHKSTSLESFPAIYRNECILPSNQSTVPKRMRWLPGLCHPVSAWAPKVNPPHPGSTKPLYRPFCVLKQSPKQKRGWGSWRWMIPHSGKHCLSKCVLLPNTPHAWPHDWLIIFKTTARDLPSANPTQQGSGLTRWSCFL